jgi:hypothetical protein
MNVSLRMMVCGVYGYSLVTVLNFAHPGWFEETRAEVVRLVASHQQGQELRNRMGTILRCQQSKHEVVADVIARRMSLREAAVRFRDLDLRHKDHRWWEQFRRRYAGQSETERHCREVIEWTEAVLTKREEGDAVARAAQLEDELQNMLECERQEEPEPLTCR